MCRNLYTFANAQKDHRLLELSGSLFMINKDLHAVHRLCWHSESEEGLYAVKTTSMFKRIKCIDIAHSNFTIGKSSI